jgi:E3 ubiquitin-protein ligase RNF14
VSCAFPFHLFLTDELTYSCLPCLNACWTLAITEGSLENVFCPSVVCTKERATKDSRAENADKGVTPALVESVVGKTLRERWERIKENRIIETGE